MIRSATKRFVLRMATTPMVTRLLRRLARDSVTIFTLHRLADPTRGVEGLDPAVLESVLDRLSREGVRFLSVDQAVIEGSHPPNGGRMPAVSFTLDDGYREQVAAAQIFRRFRTPATVFLTSGFLDGDLWLWWDRLEYVLEETRVKQFEWQGRTVDLSDGEARNLLLAHERERMKTLPWRLIQAHIGELASRLEVEVPAHPPARYEPATWEDARQAEALGMTFGAHTVQHPILSRETREDAAREIRDSWTRLRDELSNASRIFAFPNGTPADFGEREVRLLREAGFHGAVTMEDRVMRPGADAKEDPFLIPRIAFPHTQPEALSPVLGVRTARGLLRSRRKEPRTRGGDPVSGQGPAAAR